MPTINKKPIRQKQTPYKHDRKSAKYYNTKQWINLRNYYLRNNPLCEECLRQGIVKEAVEVHHKRFILSGKDEYERYNLLTDERNLMSLCLAHHKEMHNIARKYNLSYIDHC